METDVSGYGKYILNVRLSKFLGLFRIISRPTHGKPYGYNNFQLLLCFGVVASLCLMCVALLGVCEIVEENPFHVLMPVVVIQNVLFGCYKLVILTRFSDKIRKLLDVTREDFGGHCTSHRSGPFQRFRARSLRITNVIFFSSVLALGNTSVPLIFLPLKSTIKRGNGSKESYRFNVLSLIYPVTGDTYDKWYYLFFTYEMSVASMFMLITNIFDSFMIPVCLAMCSHLEVVGLNYSWLGHGERPKFDDESHHVKNKTVSIDDIKEIIMYHQKVNQKLSDFYSIVRPIILPHIMLCSNTITFVFYIIMVYMDSAEYRFQGLLTLAAVIYFIIQLLIPCYFFGLVDDTKESVNFAIYSSNWTEMDIECKKLILLAMHMNNANNLQMRITPNKVVNLEVFKSAIHTCYSILSVMANAKNSK